VTFGPQIVFGRSYATHAWGIFVGEAMTYIIIIFLSNPLPLISFPHNQVSFKWREWKIRGPKYMKAFIPRKMTEISVLSSSYFLLHHDDMNLRAPGLKTRMLGSSMNWMDSQQKTQVTN